VSPTKSGPEIEKWGIAEKLKLVFTKLNLIRAGILKIASSVRRKCRTFGPLSPCVLPDYSPPDNSQFLDLQKKWNIAS
jgi:hypothetical protein